MCRLVFSQQVRLYTTAICFCSKEFKGSSDQASQNTENSKINTYADVTKAFFDVLLTQEQSNVLNEDILRLQQNYKTAYHLIRMVSQTNRLSAY